MSGVLAFLNESCQSCVPVPLRSARIGRDVLATRLSARAGGGARLCAPDDSRRSSQRSASRRVAGNWERSRRGSATHDEDEEIAAEFAVGQRIVNAALEGV